MIIYYKIIFFFEEIKMEYINHGVVDTSVQGVLKVSVQQTNSHNV